MKLNKTLIAAINTYMACKWINDGWFLENGLKERLIKDIGNAAQKSNIGWALSCGTVWLTKGKQSIEINGPILPNGVGYRVINRDEKGIIKLKASLLNY